MSAVEGLLTAILQEPDDDISRLIYSDWLEDHGDKDRAEFIRTQIHLANNQGAAGRSLPTANHARSREAMLRRVSELLALHRDDWEAPLRAACPGITTIEFCRGFPTHITVCASDLLTAAELIVRSAPVTSVQITGCSAGQVAKLAQSPCLARLATLDLRENTIGDAGAAALAASPYLTHLTSLALNETGIGDEGAGALAYARNLTQLSSLDLRGNNIGDRGAQALIRSHCLPPLLLLRLAGNDLGASVDRESARTYARRRYFGQSR